MSCSSPKNWMKTWTTDFHKVKVVGWSCQTLDLRLENQMLVDILVFFNGICRQPSSMLSNENLFATVNPSSGFVLARSSQRVSWTMPVFLMPWMLFIPYWIYPSIHSRVPCWGFSITRMGLCPPPFLASVWFLFLTLPWKIKICTASKCSASEESLKEIGRNCLNLSRLRCCMETPIVSQISLLCFVARNFWVLRASAWTYFSCVCVCLVLFPPKQLRKSHSPLGKSECFKSL